MSTKSTETIANADLPSELEMPLWSVISFEKCERSGLVYSEALQMMADLETAKMPGLSIVTDAAAQRIKRS